MTLTGPRWTDLLLQLSSSAFVEDEVADESGEDRPRSPPTKLDVIFTLEGRVRPYHEYLPWELRRHPLADWHADELLALLTATLDGDPAAIRATFERVETACAAFDSVRPDPVLMPVVEGWGDELSLLRR
jgi:hypothetical protein